jgi:beta-galactosidase
MGNKTQIVFNTVRGTITSFNHRGKEFIRVGPQPDLWRPPTDNDYGNKMDTRLSIWKNAWERTQLRSYNFHQPQPGKVLVTFSYVINNMAGEKIADYSTEYTIYGTADVVIKNKFIKTSVNIPEIPRMGMQMQLPAEFSKIKWFGRGPHENYIDRKTSAEIGLYESTVADQYVPYIRPQENGYRTDTRWLILYNDDGTGILITGDPLFCFAALNYIHDDFESPGKLGGYRKDAKKVNTHTVDIKPRNLVSLNIDLTQMGVGGDNSWGAMTHSQYRLTAIQYDYAFRLKPVVKDDEHAR